TPAPVAQKRQAGRAIRKFEQQGRAFSPEMAGRDTVPGGCLKERGGLILAREGLPQIDRTGFHETDDVIASRSPTAPCATVRPARRPLDGARRAITHRTCLGRLVMFGILFVRLG